MVGRKPVTLTTTMHFRRPEGADMPRLLTLVISANIVVRGEILVAQKLDFDFFSRTELVRLAALGHHQARDQD